MVVGKEFRGKDSRRAAPDSNANKTRRPHAAGPCTQAV